MNFERIAALDDAERPWRQIWRCPTTGVHVKIYARRKPAPFGKIVYEITGSACDAHGHGASDTVLAFSDARPRPRLLQRHADRDPGEIEPLAVELDREIRFVVAKVIYAVANAREAD